VKSHQLIRSTTAFPRLMGQSLRDEKIIDNPYHTCSRDFTPRIQKNQGLQNQVHEFFLLTSCKWSTFEIYLKPQCSTAECHCREMYISMSNNCWQTFTARPGKNPVWRCLIMKLSYLQSRTRKASKKVKSIFLQLLYRQK
jgi:hypothetical protein